MLVDENEKSYQVITALPGVTKSDITIKVLPNCVVVEFDGNKLIESGVLTINTDFDIDPKKIEPTLQDGVLVIDIAKPEPIILEW